MYFPIIGNIDDVLVNMFCMADKISYSVVYNMEFGQYYIFRVNLDNLDITFNYPVMEFLREILWKKFIYTCYDFWPNYD